MLEGPVSTLSQAGRALQSFRIDATEFTVVLFRDGRRIAAIEGDFEDLVRDLGEGDPCGPSVGRWCGPGLECGPASTCVAAVPVTVESLVAWRSALGVAFRGVFHDPNEQIMRLDLLTGIVARPVLVRDGAQVSFEWDSEGPIERDVISVHMVAADYYIHEVLQEDVALPDVDEPCDPRYRISRCGPDQACVADGADWGCGPLAPCEVPNLPADAFEPGAGRIPVSLACGGAGEDEVPGRVFRFVPDADGPVTLVATGEPRRPPHVWVARHCAARDPHLTLACGDRSDPVGRARVQFDGTAGEPVYVFVRGATPVTVQAD